MAAAEELMKLAAADFDRMWHASTPIASAIVDLWVGHDKRAILMAMARCFAIAAGEMGGCEIDAARRALAAHAGIVDSVLAHHCGAEKPRH